MIYKFNYFIVSAYLLLMSCARIKDNQIIDHHDLKYKSHEIDISFVDRGGGIYSLQTGTYFIAEEKGKYFLVTNYHILAGRNAWDTTQIDNQLGYTGNVMIAKYFHKDALIKRGKWVYRIKGDDEERLFITIPAKENSKSVVDLAFIPLDTIPSDAVIDPIYLSTMDTSWSIKPSEKIYVYGYRGVVDFSDQFPIIDTVTTVDDQSFNYRDSFLFAIKTIPFFGASGAPIYNSKNVFVGVVSKETLTEESFLRDPELRNRKNHQLIYEFISASVLKSALDSFLLK